MRVLLTALVIVLVLPSAAEASGQTLAPPGNSGVNQYVESLPTAKGGSPTGTVHGGGPGGSAGGGVLSPGTQRAFARDGTSGRDAAALATATAPARTGSRRGVAHGGAGSASLPVSGGSDSPLTTLGRALSGSSTHGGLSPLLPVMLVVIALGAGALILRRRHTD